MKATKPAASTITREVLPNGLVVIAEHMPHARSVSIGIWVRAGSRAEPERLNGIAHFIEHMVFKGTVAAHRRTDCREMDSVGGMLDAFTSKESVCFNAKVLDEHLPMAFDVLSDLVLRPLFAEEDIAKEKQVILEEIRMEEDNPESVAHEVLTQNFWRGHPLGAPILGTRATVRRFTRDALVDCFRPWYAPEQSSSSPPRAASRCRSLLELAHRRVWQRSSRAQARAPHSAGRAPARRTRAARGAQQARARAGAHHHGRAVVSAGRSRAATPLRCSTTFSAAACRRGCFRTFASGKDWPTRFSANSIPTPTPACCRSMRAPARQNIERVLRSVAEELRRMKQEPVSRGRIAPRQGPAQGLAAAFARIVAARACPTWRARRCILADFLPCEELQASLEAVTRERRAANRPGIFPARKNRRHRAGPAGGLPADARPAGLLSVCVAAAAFRRRSAACRAILARESSSVICSSIVDALASLCDDACGRVFERLRQARVLRFSERRTGVGGIASAFA